MKLENIDRILEKASELKVFCDFGGKALPAVDEISRFMADAAPVIEGIRSLVDVTSTKLPKASQQLAQVNEASEKASTDILNSVDAIAATVESIQLDPSGVSGEIVGKTAKDLDLLVHSLFQAHKEDAAITQLMNIWDLHNQSLQAYVPDAQMKERLRKLRDDSTGIMLAMQVQDITGQQIAGVIGLMQAIDDVLRKLLSHVARDIQPQDQDHVIKPSHAAEVGANERKQLVDALLKKARVEPRAVHDHKEHIEGESTHA